MASERDDDLEIVRQATKGIAYALLKHSKLTNKEIRIAVQEAATDPVGPNKEKAQSLANPLIYTTEDDRARNRGE